MQKAKAAPKAKQPFAPDFRRYFFFNSRPQRSRARELLEIVASKLWSETEFVYECCGQCFDYNSSRLHVRRV